MRTACSTPRTENIQTDNIESADNEISELPTISELICDIPDEDKNLVTETLRMSKRQKLFGNEFIVYHVYDVPKTLSEAYASSDAEY